MKDAVGSSDGRAGDASEIEEVDGTQDLDFSSERIRRRIISSGTKEPALILDCASTPAVDCQQHVHGYFMPDEVGTRPIERYCSYPTASCCEQHCVGDPQN